MPKISYTSMKNEELFKLIEKYDLEKEDYIQENGSLNRKKLANVLKLIDLASGKTTEVQMMSSDGTIKEYKHTQKINGGLSGMMVQVTFYAVDDNDIPYVQMALNGKALMIPREKKVWIPKEYIDGCLKHAVITKMKMDIDHKGNIRYIPRQIPRFQHTVHDIKHIDVLKKEYEKKMAKRRDKDSQYLREDEDDNK